MSVCGAYATAGMFGCTTDYSEKGMSDSIYSCPSASDEVDETSNTGPVEDAEITSVDMFVDK